MKKGWLQKPGKREIRDSYTPLTDENVEKLINYILYNPSYKPTLPEEARVILRNRNAALFATLWLFGKRANEVLNLKTSDVWIHKDELFVRFVVSKKAKQYLKCTLCNELNGLDAEFCKKCGRSLKDSVVVKVGKENLVRIKRKKLSNPFIPYIINWLKIRFRFPNGYLFPPLSTVGSIRGKGKLAPIEILPQKRITEQNLWYICDEFGLTPHHFRYGFAKDLLRKTQGNVILVKEAGDWSSLDMMMEYAKSLGLTKEDEEFAKL
jgi:integrase